jgi:hypothetical protein
MHDRSLTSIDIKPIELLFSQECTLNRTYKYWKLRFSLFSKFDEEVMLDEGKL